jgi:alginate O-acetyltransferase complex protein AlgI
MAFTSIEYGLLLLATFVAYWLLPASLATPVLLVASIVFYASWNAAYLALVLLSASIGYVGGRVIDAARAEPTADGRRRVRAVLAVSVTLLLGLLAYFKYASFLLDVWSAVTGRPHAAFQVVLPLAISFYTFEIVSYLADVHRGGPAERSPWRFLTFVGFFPHLIAGPIIRAHELLPQLIARRAFNAARTIEGLELLTYGLLKKTIFADNLAVVANRVYDDPSKAGGIDVLIATLAFGAQIFADFSGYTDIARGSARLFGIELPINFRAPYLATSITDFWRRWHITLSRWLRDYLYIPLGGNRRRPARVYANLLLTMALGGLWHGASITFVLWGAYHGMLLAGERFFGRSDSRTSGYGRLPAVLTTFVAVHVGWVIFRAGNWATLSAVVARIVADPLGSNGRLDTATFLPLLALFYVLHALGYVVGPRTWPRDLRTRVAIAAPALAAMIALIVVFGRPSGSFIYFQF